MTLRHKAETLMRFHRQNAFDHDSGKADRHARAIQRIAKTATWRGIVNDRRDNSSYLEGLRLERMGY